MVTISENAAAQIKKIQEQQPGFAGKSLRMAVEDGGCSGHQYKMGFDEEIEGDLKFDSNGINILVDGQAASILNGIELDYVENLEGSKFVFNNPNATGGCGCGKSFSV